MNRDRRPSPRRIAIIAVATTMFVLAGCATGGKGPPIVESQPAQTVFSPEQVAKIDAVIGPMRDLLRLAPDVARIRWNDKTPIENRTRDAALVNRAAEQAPKFRADPGLTRDVFRALTDASNFAQAELHKQWRDEGRPPKQTLLRTPPQVQAASEEYTPKLMAALADVGPLLLVPGARAVIEARAREFMPSVSRLADPTRTIAIRPLVDRAAP